MSLIVDLLMGFLAILPESYLLTALIRYESELQPFYEIIGYANYFIPFGICVDIFTGWAILMVLTVIAYKLFWIR